MIEQLHYITQDHPNKSHADLCKEACEAGAKWIQLRLKDVGEFDWEQEAVECKEICDAHGAVLIVNDNVEVAQRVMAHGVHLGKEDLSPIKAREILGDEAIIGATANTWEDILKLSQSRIDYIGLGPFTYTSTKKKLSPILGLEGYRVLINNARQKNIQLPIIAIGGIQVNDIKDIMNTGVHGIAVSGLITSSDNKKSLIHQLTTILKG